MDSPEQAREEIRRLRTTMRDLVALAALPAVWTGLTRKALAGSLADVLLSTLALEAAYVCLTAAEDDAVEVLRKRSRSSAYDEELLASFRALLDSDPTDSLAPIANPFASGLLQVAVTRFGGQNDRGVLITASRRPHYPSEADRLLLGVGANQTAIVVERRRTEQRIHEHRESLRVTLASIGDAVLTTDVVGRVTFLNPIAESLTGWTSDDAIGRSSDDVFRIIDERTRRPLSNPVMAVLREGQPAGVASHTVLLTRGGEERPIEDSASPIRQANGDVLGCVLVFRDVTERRRQERELQDRERQFRTLAESIPQLAWMAHPDGHIFWYNRRWFEYTGTTPEQMEGWGWQAVHDPHELPRVLERWKSDLATGRPFEMVIPLRGKDGEFRPFLTFAVPILNDERQVARWFGTNTDISAQKRIEADLVEARSRLQSTLTASEIGTWEFDIVANRVWADPNLAQMFSVSPADADGGSLEVYLHAIHADDRERVGNVISDALRAGDTYECDYRLVAPDGAVRSVAARGRIQRDAVGRPLKMPGVIVDITDRKRMEDDLRQLAAHLSEADRRKDEFLATLAHELRNPLAPIRNGLQIMRLAGGDLETNDLARGVMERQVTQLSRLIDDLMDVSRISQGKLQLRRERVSLASIVAAATEGARDLIHSMGHEFTVDLPDDLVVIDGDLTRLTQVFMNLLNNAAKYSEPNGRIWLTVVRENDDAVVTVKDAGIGIARDQLPRLFELFSQVDNSLEKSQGGLGIGLSLVKRLTVMHGGSVEAKSEGIGRGSEFIVRLPVALAAPLAPASHPDEAVAARAFRVLIVDDNRDSADTLAAMLKLLGHEIRVAYDGIAAVTAARDFGADVVLLDLGLPKLNGYEACARIREQTSGKQPVIIAQTGWGSEEDYKRTHEAGFDHHLIKPIDPAALRALLSDLPTDRG